MCFPGEAMFAFKPGYVMYTIRQNRMHMRGSRGGGLKNHKNIGFLGNTGPDPLKNQKATMPDLMLGHYRPASEWRFAGGPIMAHL